MSEEEFSLLVKEVEKKAALLKPCLKALKVKQLVPKEIMDRLLVLMENLKRIAEYCDSDSKKNGDLEVAIIAVKLEKLLGLTKKQQKMR